MSANLQIVTHLLAIALVSCSTSGRTSPVRAVDEDGATQADAQGPNAFDGSTIGASTPIPDELENSGDGGLALCGPGIKRTVPHQVSFGFTGASGDWSKFIEKVDNGEVGSFSVQKTNIVATTVIVDERAVFSSVISGAWSTKDISVAGHIILDGYRANLKNILPGSVFKYSRKSRLYQSNDGEAAKEAIHCLRSSNGSLLVGIVSAVAPLSGETAFFPNKILPEADALPEERGCLLEATDPSAMLVPLNISVRGSETVTVSNRRSRAVAGFDVRVQSSVRYPGAERAWQMEFGMTASELLETE